MKYARPAGGKSGDKDKKGGESKKEAAKDVQATFYSTPDYAEDRRPPRAGVGV